MDLSILFGFIIGIILALPPGPVGVTAIEMGLFESKKAGFKLALGNAIMDFFYSLGAIFATSAVITALDQFTADFPNLYLFFQITVIIAFLIVGVLNLRAQKKKKELGSEMDDNKGFTAKLGSRGPLFLGIAIALTNLANPTFTPTLAGVTLWVHKTGFVTGTAVSNVLFALGFGLGNLFWINLLSQMVRKYKHKFSEKMIFRIKQMAGVTFIGFGTFLGVRLFAISKWPEVLRILLAF